MGCHVSKQPKSCSKENGEQDANQQKKIQNQSQSTMVTFRKGRQNTISFPSTGFNSASTNNIQEQKFQISPDLLAASNKELENQFLEDNFCLDQIDLKNTGYEDNNNNFSLLQQIFYSHLQYLNMIKKNGNQLDQQDIKKQIESNLKKVKGKINQYRVTENYLQVRKVVKVEKNYKENPAPIINKKLDKSLIFKKRMVFGQSIQRSIEKNLEQAQEQEVC